jgi:hypothetical protein
MNELVSLSLPMIDHSYSLSLSLSPSLSPPPPPTTKARTLPLFLLQQHQQPCLQTQSGPSFSLSSSFGI